MRAHLVVLLVGIAACSSPSKSSAPTSCVRPSGLYFVTYQTVDGNCGNLPAGIVNVGGPTQGCVDNIPESSDACRDNTDSTCATPEGGKVHIVGYAISEDANSDMLHGTATMTVSDAAGRVVCVGTYNARWVRQ